MLPLNNVSHDKRSSGGGKRGRRASVAIGCGVDGRGIEKRETYTLKLEIS
jgi:hypothetical protein